MSVAASVASSSRAVLSPDGRTWSLSWRRSSKSGTGCSVRLSQCCVTSAGELFRGPAGQQLGVAAVAGAAQEEEEVAGHERLRHGRRTTTACVRSICTRMQSSATPSLSESAPERVRSGSGYSESSHTAYASASLFRFRAVSLMFDVVSHEEW